MNEESDQVQDGEAPSPFLILGSQRLPKSEMDAIKNRFLDFLLASVPPPPPAELVQDIGKLLQHADACEDEMRRLRRNAKAWQDAADAKTVPSLRWWLTLYAIAAFAGFMFIWQYFGR